MKSTLLALVSVLFFNAVVPYSVIMTTSGELCKFPFEYKGVSYNDCTKAKHHRPWCSFDPVYKGRWGDCLVPCAIHTTSGKCCKFPFKYKDVWYDDCTRADHHRPWCSLDRAFKRKWGDCEVPCPIKTTLGECCSIPFRFRGVKYNDCTATGDHRPWCSLDSVYKNKSRWGSCHVPCPVKTTLGKCCRFPFEYKGVTYKDCTKSDHHRAWCSLDTLFKGRWGICKY